MKTNAKLYLALGFIAGFYFIVMGCGSGSNDYAESDSARIAFEQIDGNNDGAIDNTVIYSYNNLGQLTQKKYEAGYYATTESYLYYFYNDDGFLKEKILEDAEGGVIKHSKYNYDDSCFKNSVDSVLGSSYGTESVTMYCDENGKVRLRQFDYNEDLVIDEEVEYTIDECGHITSETHFDQNGDEIDWAYCSYQNDCDDDGKLLSRIGYSHDDAIFFMSTYTYVGGSISTLKFDRYSGGEYDSTSMIYYIYE
jgi:hypothetical protein